MPKRSPRAASAKPPPVDLMVRAVHAAQILDRISTMEAGCYRVIA